MPVTPLNVYEYVRKYAEHRMLVVAEQPLHVSHGHTHTTGITHRWLKSFVWENLWKISATLLKDVVLLITLFKTPLIRIGHICVQVHFKVRAT